MTKILHKLRVTILFPKNKTQKILGLYLSLQYFISIKRIYFSSRLYK